jgi:putative transposase
LITVGSETTIEKAVQFIKGGFSYRLKKEIGYLGDVRQRGFSEERVKDEEGFLRVREYIAYNPVEVGLVESPARFPRPARLKSCPDTRPPLVTRVTPSSGA